MTNASWHKLFLIAGPSGVGKSTLAEWILPRVPSLVFLQKAVTRSRRPGERLGREVVLFDEGAFHKKVREGCIVAPYQKYREWYGVFASSWDGILEAGAPKTIISGIDVLELSDAITVGDAYEAPAEITRVFPNTKTLLLYASFRVIVQRIFDKNMPHQERKIRLVTVEKEFQNGFPRDVKMYDYSLFTEKPLNIVGEELLSIIGKERNT